MLQTTLQIDLQRQLREEIGDTENTPDSTMAALKQKFGLTANIQLTPVEKYWVHTEDIL